MSSTQPAPHPLDVHKTNPLPPSTASSHLTAFLTRASIDPSYRPDSTLSNRGDGPQSNSGGTGNVNLTLYHLDRILKGINGEDLGIGKAEEILGKIENEETKFEDQGFGKPERQGRAAKKGPSQRLTSVPVITTAEEQAAAAAAQQTQDQPDGTTASEWQDKDTYDLAQDIEQGEVGDRDPPAIPEGFPEGLGPQGGKQFTTEDVHMAGDAMDLDQDTGVAPAVLPRMRELTAKEKEERKLAKKLRLKEARKAGK